MSLLKFANLTDAKRALANPKKALRVVRKHFHGSETTAVDDSTALDDERIDAICTIFDVKPAELEDLLSDLRHGPIQERLNYCEAVMENYQFGLGGMKAGGETAYLVARVLEPASVCEVGVANGVSTAYLLGAAERGGFTPDIRGIDRPLFERTVREERGVRGLRGSGGIVPDEKEACWVAPRKQRHEYGYQYYVGDFTEILPSVLGDMGNIDLALYDASKDGVEMRMAYRNLIDSLNPGGVLISDDIEVNSAFEEIAGEAEGRMECFGGCGLFRKCR